MVLLIAVFGCSFVLALAMTPVFRGLALRLGYVDRPDDGRKRHAHPVPRVGGVPIVLASVASVVLLAGGPRDGGGVRGVGGVLGGGALLSFAALARAVLAIFATGLLDDLVTLKPWQKLAGE